MRWFYSVMSISYLSKLSFRWLNDELDSVWVILLFNLVKLRQSILVRVILRLYFGMLKCLLRLTVEPAWLSSPWIKEELEAYLCFSWDMLLILLYLLYVVFVLLWKFIWFWAGTADCSLESPLDPSREPPFPKNLFDLLILILRLKMIESFDVLWLILGSTLTYLNSCVLLFNSDDLLTPLDRRIFEILLRYTWLDKFLGGIIMLDALRIRLSFALRLSILDPLVFLI